MVHQELQRWFAHATTDLEEAASVIIVQTRRTEARSLAEELNEPMRRHQLPAHCCKLLFFGRARLERRHREAQVYLSGRLHDFDTVKVIDLKGCAISADLGN
jgi:hypothetical protein